MEKYFKGFSIFTGVVRYSDLAYLLATQDALVKQEVPHTRIYTCDRGSWGGEDYDWTAISASVCFVPDERFIAISPLGRVQVFGGGKIEEEKKIIDNNLSPEKRGPLREVRGVAEGKAYAVGTCRQAYRRNAPGEWVCIDQTAQTQTDDMTEYCFESIDGFSENNIYAVGWEGEIWHYDGKKWSQIESPTNLTLFKVRCGGDGYVYSCGQAGVLVRGKGEKWEIIDHGTTEDNLRGMAWFQGKMFISSMTNIYELIGGNLNKLKFSVPSPSTCNHLDAKDGIMWSIGAKDVMQYDGKMWTKILKL